MSKIPDRSNPLPINANLFGAAYGPSVPPLTPKPPIKKKEPLIVIAMDKTIRINPRQTKTAFLVLQIMEPPEYDDNGRTLQEGRFTQIYLHYENAKALADAIYAEEVLDLVE